jgi:hypothetical protein
VSQLSPLNRKRRAAPVIDAKHPRALAICDGCGFQVNHDHLREKMEYRGGSTPVGTGLYVCASCDDVPQPFFRKLVLPPDPVPVSNPRPDDRSGAASGFGYLVTSSSGGDFLVTSNDTWDWQWIGTV